MKKANRNYVVIFLFFLLQLAMESTVYAQISEQQKLGIQYFEKAEYDKSKEVFEKLFSKNADEINYSYYLNSLLELKEYKTAEKTIRKLLKKQGYSSQLQVDLGSVFLKNGDEKTAFQEFEKAIDKLSPNQSDVIQLAGIFQQKNLIDFTIKTYLKGQSMLRGIYPFYFELAEAYNGKGDIANMIDQYLESINFNSIYLVQVQNALQTNLGEENNTENKKLL
ncbi:MAG: tetratricopeptide repeat protein, partial [Bacteroidia bacterium]